MDRLNHIGRNGKDSFSETLSYAALGLQASLFQAKTQRIVKIRVIRDHLWVFFDNCYPFKIYQNGDFFDVGVYWAMGDKGDLRDDIKLMPYNIPANDLNLMKLNSSNTLFRKRGNQFLSANEGLLSLKTERIDSENISVRADYKNLTSTTNTLYVRRDEASLKKFIGQVVLVNFTQEVSETQNTAIDQTVSELPIAGGVRETVKTSAQFILRRMNYHWLIISSFIQAQNYSVEGTSEDIDEFGGYVRLDHFLANVEKVKCRYFQLVNNQSDIAGKNIEEFSFGDFIDSFPKDGGFLEGKTFLVTERGKICFSGLNSELFKSSTDMFDSPIKSMSGFSKIKRQDSLLYDLAYSPATAFSNISGRQGTLTLFKNTYLTPFIEDINQDDSYTFSFLDTDAIAYRIRDERGNVVNIFQFESLFLNTFRGRSQALMTTDRGVYYWSYETSSAGGDTSILTRKSTDFLANKDVNILETHNRVYVVGGGEEGGLCQQILRKSCLFCDADCQSQL